MAKYPYKRRQFLHQLFHLRVFALLDGTAYPQRPHSGGVEAVGVTLDYFNLQQYARVYHVTALIYSESKEDVLRLDVWSHHVSEKLRRQLRAQRPIKHKKGKKK